MLQVRLFQGIEDERRALEEEINTWLKETDPKVVQMVGNVAPQTVMEPAAGSSNRRFAPSDLFVMFLYETSA